MQSFLRTIPGFNPAQKLDQPVTRPKAPRQPSKTADAQKPR